MLYELFAVYFWLWASKAPACLLVLKCIPKRCEDGCPTVGASCVARP